MMKGIGVVSLSAESDSSGEIKLLTCALAHDKDMHRVFGRARCIVLADAMSWIEFHKRAKILFKSLFLAPNFFNIRLASAGS